MSEIKFLKGGYDNFQKKLISQSNPNTIYVTTGSTNSENRIYLGSTMLSRGDNDDILSIIEENEKVTAMSLADLESRKCEKSFAIAELNKKQSVLVSGKNIKTINNKTILGSGDIKISSVGSKYDGDSVFVNQYPEEIRDIVKGEVFNNYTYNGIGNNEEIILPNVAQGTFSHSEGKNSMSFGPYSHAEGSATNYSFLSQEKSGTVISGKSEIKISYLYESDLTKAFFLTISINGKTTFLYPKNRKYEPSDIHKENPIWEVTSDIISGIASSFNCTVNLFSYGAIGSSSHREGCDTSSIGEASHTEGFMTTAMNKAEHAEGMYNVSHNGNSKNKNTLSSIGFGSQTANANALEVMQNGDMYVYGVNGYDGKTVNGNTLQKVITDLVNRVAELEKMLNINSGDTKWK